MSAGAPLIETVGIGKAYGSFAALDDVTLSVRDGELVSIVGPNGAGKTSLLEAISGIVTTIHGNITMDEQDVRRLSRRKRALSGISHVEQGRMIFPSLTVRENLALTARKKTDFDEAIALFPELEKRIDSTAALLSGGEQQMVVLARSFAAKPKYLLIDEMSLGLAPVVFLRLIPTIRQIASTGVGVLLVEQFAHLALGVASSALVVTGGRVSYQGTPADLLSDDGLLRKAYLG
jgi:branched-chain amino acid transport system ATP-binding protein